MPKVKRFTLIIKHELEEMQRRFVLTKMNLFMFPQVCSLWKCWLAPCAFVWLFAVMDKKDLTSGIGEMLSVNLPGVDSSVIPKSWISRKRFVTRFTSERFLTVKSEGFSLIQKIDWVDFSLPCVNSFVVFKMSWLRKPLSTRPWKQWQSSTKILRHF